MTLKEYVQHLNELVENLAVDAESLTVVYSSDSEGNDYDTVYYAPTLGHYEDREFTSDEEEIEEREVSYNSVCIN